MAAGKRIYRVTVQSRTDTINAAGTPASTWTDKAKAWAEIVQRGTEEFQRGFGASDETTIIFRTLYMHGITTADRILYAGKAFDIRQVVDYGRRRGLDLHCVALSGVD